MVPSVQRNVGNLESPVDMLANSNGTSLLTHQN